MEYLELQNLAKKLVTSPKGLLAADESSPTITKRFAALGLTSTPELNFAYRKLLLTTPGIEQLISGVILYDETVRQNDGELVKTLKEKGMIPGIKVDQGLEKVEDENLTKGLDGLDGRLKEYKSMGLEFTKWRAAFMIDDMHPSKKNLEENFDRLTEYAKISQENGFVPIVEPEVLMKGMHTTTRCEEITRDGLKLLFEKLMKADIDLKALILKVNMVLPGADNGVKAEAYEVGNVTLRTLKNSVPDETGGIVFLSGGQTPVQATENLNEIEKLSKNTEVANYVWPLSFSFSRALQNEAMATWNGKEENVGHAQEVFLNRAKLVSLAREGKYEPSMERPIDGQS